MKLKYFLRGLGAGIIFGAVIMLVAYMTSGGYKLSDKEIISRAEKLGMVFEEDETASGSDAMQNDDPKADESDTTEEVTTTEKPVTEDAVSTTEQITEITTEHTEETVTTTAQQDDYAVATITVVGGMGSEQVAQLLMDAGIIDDAADFDSFLNRNGYSTRIEIGTYEINNQMTYEEIANILSTKK